ncbi:MAG: hypothetical protein ACLGHY_03395 [Gammaproteobacteria bacterium]
MLFMEVPAVVILERHLPASHDGKVKAVFHRAAPVGRHLVQIAPGSASATRLSDAIREAGCTPVEVESAAGEHLHLPARLVYFDAIPGRRPLASCSNAHSPL